MEFVRKKKRGQHQQTRRTWESEEGYRIVWRNEVCGVTVSPKYQATVRTLIPNYGTEGNHIEMWDFTEKKRLFRTLKAAKQSCEKHHKKWTKACEASGERMLTKIFDRIPFGIPIWVKTKLPRKIYGRLVQPR